LTATAADTPRIQRPVAPPSELFRGRRRPGALPAHLPALGVGLLWFVAVSWIAIAEHETYNSTSRDFGVYLQVLWNTAHGRPFQTTLLESNRVHLAEHVALLLPVLAPFYAAAPDPRRLLVLQQAVLALSGIPIYLLARHLLGGVWLPTLVIAAFYATPTLAEIALDAFYPVTFTALPLGFAAYSFLRGRRRLGAACALIALPIEEEAALTVLGLGGFVLLRRDGRRWGALLVGAAALWLGVVALVVMPRFHEPSTLPATADNRTIAHFDQFRSDPAGALGTLFAERTPLAVRWLLAPTGGLALLAPEVLAIDLPHAATLLIADKEGRYRRHWAAPLLPPIWLATVVGLSRLRRPALRTVGVGLLVVGSAASYWADSSLPGGGQHEPEDVVWSERAEQLRYLVEAVPPDATVAASRRALGHLADRPELYVFPPSYAGKLWPPERRVQAYVLDLTNDQTREALAGRQSPLRAGRPYAIWLAGPDAMLLTDRPPPPTRPVGQQVGGLHLLGYDLRRDGPVVEVALHWQAPAGLARPQRRAARLLDDSSAVLARSDQSALDALFPASDWPTNQVVIDRLRFLPSGGPPAQLDVGWFDQHGNLDLVRLSLDAPAP
jgi:uncharacterized membrane protein